MVNNGLITLEMTLHMYFTRLAHHLPSVVHLVSTFWVQPKHLWIFTRNEIMPYLHVHVQCILYTYMQCSCSHHISLRIHYKWTWLHCSV